jgi:hypothetical protein
LLLADGRVHFRGVLPVQRHPLFAGRPAQPTGAQEVVEGVADLFVTAQVDGEAGGAAEHVKHGNDLEEEANLLELLVIVVG